MNYFFNVALLLKELTDLRKEKQNKALYIVPFVSGYLLH